MMKASQVAMSATVIPLVATFDKYDAYAKASFQQLTEQMIMNSGNISMQLNLFNTLLNRTISLSELVASGASKTMNNIALIQGTTSILLDSVSALAKVANPNAISLDLVMQGLNSTSTW